MGCKYKYVCTNYHIICIMNRLLPNHKDSARCTLNKKILNLLNDESVSGESSGRASQYIRQEVLPQMFEKAQVTRNEEGCWNTIYELITV